MKFSVVIPSYLGEYQGAASNRESKIIRCFDSLINQSFKDFEIIVISDGCDKTVSICKEYFEDKEVNIKLYKVQKTKLWGGIRNYGIEKAEGDYIIYLDIDDYYCKDYLKNLSKEITLHDWYFVNDFKYKHKQFILDNCQLKFGKCGTSNIIHKRTMKARWLKSDYGEDWQFIKMLQKESDNTIKLTSIGYYVCHIPKTYDV